MTLAVVFMDGSEHVPRQDDKWKGTVHNTAPVSGVSGAHGKVCDDATWGAKRFVAPAPTTKGTLRGRVMFRADSGSNNSFILFRPDSSHIHLEAARNADGTISIIGAAGTFTHTTIDTYALDTWFEVELRCHAAASGDYLFKVDGVIPSRSGGGKMYASGVNTKHGSDASITFFDFGNSALQTYTDDAVIDTAKNNLGTGQVETLYSTGAGALANLTRGGSDTLANYSQCNEAVADGNTTYVFAPIDALRDCYSFPDLSITGAVYIVQVSAMLIHGSSGDPSFHCKLFLRIDGVNYDGDITHNALSNYDCFTEVWNLNPATGAAWTVEQINSLQAGLYAIDNDVWMSQIVIEVAALTPTPDFVEAGFRNYCGSVEPEVN